MIALAPPPRRVHPDAPTRPCIAVNGPPAARTGELHQCATDGCYTPTDTDHCPRHQEAHRG